MRVVRLALAAIAASLLLASPAGAVTAIHAHRGGPIEAGVPTAPEDAQPAFDRAHAIGADVIELDAKVSSDGVPVVMHDATLDRTTDCTGQVAQKTAAELAACHVDVLGSEANIKQAPGATVPIPPLAEFLAWAKAAGAHINLEIKNQPTDPDYDPTPGFARTVLGAVTASGIPRDHVLIQSFWPANLDEAKAQGFRTSFLTLAQTNSGSIEFAQSNGYDVVSPAWPPSSDPADYVKRAHAAGKQVVPYTFNEAAEVEDAVAAGVDAVIANDVIVAQRVIYGTDCPAAQRTEASLRSAWRRRAGPAAAPGPRRHARRPRPRCAT